MAESQQCDRRFLAERVFILKYVWSGGGKIHAVAKTSICKIVLMIKDANNFHFGKFPVLKKNKFILLHLNFYLHPPPSNFPFCSSNQILHYLKNLSFFEKKTSAHLLL